MSSRLQIIFFTLLLSSIGIGIALYKGLVLGIPFTPDETTSIYRLGAKISFTAKDEPIKISLALPSDQEGITRYCLSRLWLQYCFHDGGKTC